MLRARCWGQHLCHQMTDFDWKGLHLKILESVRGKRVRKESTNWDGGEAELSCSWKTSLSATRFSQEFWNKQTKTFSDVSNEAGDWGIFTLMWSVGNVVASGRTQKTRAKQFSLAEGPATQGVQLWVVSNQHSQQLGMLGISGACGRLVPTPTLAHTCVLGATFSNEFARLGATPPGVWSISFPV